MFDLGYYQVHSQDKSLWAVVDNKTKRIYSYGNSLAIYTTRRAARRLAALFDKGLVSVKRIVLL